MNQIFNDPIAAIKKIISIVAMPINMNGSHRFYQMVAALKSSKWSVKRTRFQRTAYLGR